MTQKPFNPPHQSAIDVAYALTKTAIGAISPASAIAIEAFSLLIAPPYQRRQVDWMEDIGSRILELENGTAGLREELQNDAAFIDTLLQASQAAIRTSDADKRAALRNAVMNSVTDDRPDDSRRQMFVNMIDEFTPWHLRLLDLLDDPKRWFQKRGRTPPQFAISSNLPRLVTDAYSELSDQSEFYEQIAKELHGRGLVSIANFGGMMTATGAYERRTTDIGRKFLKFISEPA